MDTEISADELAFQVACRESPPLVKPMDSRGQAPVRTNLPLLLRVPPVSSPLPHCILSVAPLIGDKRCYGGDTERIRRGSGGNVVWKRARDSTFHVWNSSGQGFVPSNAVHPSARGGCRRAGGHFIHLFAYPCMAYNSSKQRSRLSSAGQFPNQMPGVPIERPPAGRSCGYVCTPCSTAQARPCG
jgi:hypothetical protein